MTEKLDALLAVQNSRDVRKPAEKHPVGFQPGIHVGQQGGEIVLRQDNAETPADWTAVLRELLPEGFDPSEYEVDGSTVEVRAWDGNIGNGELKRFYYFKARIRRKGVFSDAVDLDDIIAVAKKAKPKASTVVDNSRTYFVQITDLQAGQADGDGVAGMVNRALQIPQLVKDDLAALKRSGREASKIFIPITGDLVEGISGWYEMQTFSVQLDRREQVKLVRRLLTEIMVEIASFGLPVHVATVPGNHGENRADGKAFTTLGDNDDVAVVEQIAEAFALSEKFGHVTFSFPHKERLSLTVEVEGWVIGLTHGHVARTTGTPAAKILNWFKNMAVARDPIGDSDLLFTGHYHHLICQQLVGDTWLIQGGALCDASAWFSQTAGLVSDPCIIKGTITRAQKVESLMPYTWDRTRFPSTTIQE
jgi:predicted phosphodiesterase